MDYSPPGSSVRGVLQARILEWVGIFPTQGLNLPLLCFLGWQVGSFMTGTTWEALSLITSDLLLLLSHFGRVLLCTSP